MLGVDPKTHPCVLHTYHSPMPWATHLHHVVPEAWTRAASMPEGRTVPVCPTGHDALHRALTATLSGRPPLHRIDTRTKALIAEALAWALVAGIEHDTLAILNAELL